MHAGKKDKRRKIKMGRYIYNASYCPTVNDFLEYYTIEDPKQKAFRIYSFQPLCI